MNVAVIGGTGVLGRLVAAELAARGDHAIAVSRSAPANGAALADGVEHRRADLRGGDGLDVALVGVDAVVDAYNDQRAKGDVLAAGNRVLLAAEAKAGVSHHVAVSIIGCDRAPMAYYRAKVAQEAVVTGGPVAWSLLRATQFHQLVAYLFESFARARLRPTGAIPVQPIDPAVVAARLVDAVHAGPGGRLPDVGGPEVRTLTQLAADWKAHRGGAVPLRLPVPGKLGRALRAGVLTDAGAALPGPTFAQWLAGEGVGVRESAAA